MNQDRVKEVLVKYLPEGAEDFSVIFTGKESSKVDGLYNRETSEILIHNRNFRDDNELLYTAFHQLAHHIYYINNPKKEERNSHTLEYQKILHGIVIKAMDSGDFETLDVPEVRAVINMGKQHTKFLKDYGKLLVELEDKCQQRNYPFEDIIERVMQSRLSEIKTIMKMYVFDVPEDLDCELARNIVKLKKPEEVQEAIEKKALPSARPVEKDEYELTEIERTIAAKEKQALKIQKYLEELYLLKEGLEASHEG